MAVTDIIIILGILGAGGIIAYMLKETIKWDRIVVTGEHFLLLIIGILILIIIFGRTIISNAISLAFSPELIPFWVFIGLLIGFVAIFYVGKLFKQL